MSTIPHAHAILTADTSISAVVRCEEGTIRLSEVDSLELCYNGRYTQLCYEGLQETTGRVACRELGFTLEELIQTQGNMLIGGKKYVFSIFYPIWQASMMPQY